MISGEGDVPWDGDGAPPWREFGTMVESAVITDGITSLGGGTFQGFNNLKNMLLFR
jgi:hypothetical protein